MAEKNDDCEGEPERGSSTGKETLCRKWVGDETQLHTGDTTHTNTPKVKEKNHISSSLTGERSGRTKGRRTCFRARTE